VRRGAPPHPNEAFALDTPSAGVMMGRSSALWQGAWVWGRGRGSENGGFRQTITSF